MAEAVPFFYFLKKKIKCEKQIFVTYIAHPGFESM